MLSVRGKKQIRTTMTTLDVSPNPNHRISKGAIARI